MKKQFSEAGFIYKCSDCGNEYQEDEVTYLCPSCESKNIENQPAKGVLNLVYDFDKLKSQKADFNYLKKTEFIDLLPIKSLDSLPHRPAKFV